MKKRINRKTITPTPEMDQPYWTFIRNGGRLCVSQVIWTNNAIDKRAFEQGIAFMSESEAEIFFNNIWVNNHG